MSSLSTTPETRHTFHLTTAADIKGKRADTFEEAKPARQNVVRLRHDHHFATVETDADVHLTTHVEHG